MTVRQTLGTVFAVAILYFTSGCNQGDAAAGHSVDEKNVLTLTKDSFQAEVLSSSQPVLVDFWATWCGPCKIMAPTVAELATELQGKVKVGKVDVDAQQELAEKYDINGIPAFLIFKDGEKVDQLVGIHSKEDLMTALKKVTPNAGTNSVAPNS